MRHRLPRRRRIAATYRTTPGTLCRLVVDLALPGGEAMVDRDDPDDRAHGDVHVAIRDAFAPAGRRLTDFAPRRRGEEETQRARFRRGEEGRRGRGVKPTGAPR